MIIVEEIALINVRDIYSLRHRVRAPSVLPRLFSLVFHSLLLLYFYGNIHEHTYAEVRGMYNQLFPCLLRRRKRLAGMKCDDSESSWICLFSLVGGTRYVR